MSKNIDPWELLASARVALQGVATYDAHPDVSWTLTKEGCRDALDCIDAALAAREAEERVEWEMVDIDYPIHHADCAGAELVVFENLFPASPKESRWHWKTGRQGDCDTFDEAKSAAIRAAKEIK